MLGTLVDNWANYLRTCRLFLIDSCVSNHLRFSSTVTWKRLSAIDEDCDTVVYGTRGRRTDCLLGSKVWRTQLFRTYMTNNLTIQPRGAQHGRNHELIRL